MDENNSTGVDIHITPDLAREIMSEPSTPTPFKERAASTAQTTLVLGAMAAAFTGASFGWAKAMDWLEERNLKRKSTGRSANDSQ